MSGPLIYDVVSQEAPNSRDPPIPVLDFDVEMVIHRRDAQNGKKRPGYLVMLIADDKHDQQL